MVYRRMEDWKMIAIEGYCIQNGIDFNYWGMFEEIGMTEENWKKVKKAIPSLFHA